MKKSIYVESLVKMEVKQVAALPERLAITDLEISLLPRSIHFYSVVFSKKHHDDVISRHHDAIMIKHVKKLDISFHLQFPYTDKKEDSYVLSCVYYNRGA